MGVAPGVGGDTGGGSSVGADPPQIVFGDEDDDVAVDGWLSVIAALGQGSSFDGVREVSSGRTVGMISPRRGLDR